METNEWRQWDKSYESVKAIAELMPHLDSVHVNVSHRGSTPEQMLLRVEGVNHSIIMQPFAWVSYDNPTIKVIPNQVHAYLQRMRCNLYSEPILAYNVIRVGEMYEKDMVTRYELANLHKAEGVKWQERLSIREDGGKAYFPQGQLVYDVDNDRWVKDSTDIERPTTDRKRVYEALLRIMERGETYHEA